MEREVELYTLNAGCLMRLLGSFQVRVVIGLDKRDLLYVYNERNGHYRANKLLEQGLKQSCRPNMNNESLVWVRCSTCHHFGPPYIHVNLRPIQADYPLQSIAIDILGPFCPLPQW